ncbi:MAG: zinc ribbon domain-containing protein [Anaerolineae bacterium]|nr:zinc ribbon domain-containing protein [Thermoflexales bacterium]MDW8407820.1 zinc ribbon domain-containing protein [Anaerolineae bacterium]
MPIYEYRCLSCKRKVSIFWRSMSAVDESQARCSYCGSSRLSRLASRVRVIRGGSRDESVDSSPAGSDDLDMPDLEGLDENDPRSLGRFLRKMAAETGEDMGPEFEEVVGRLEKGEDPEKIEESMGDLFGEPPGLDDEEPDMSSSASMNEEPVSAGSEQRAGDKSKTPETPRRHMAVSAKAKRVTATKGARKPARSSSSRRGRKKPA